MRGFINRRRLLLLIVAAVLLIWIFVTWLENQANIKALAEQVTVGMRKDQVEAIMGPPEMEFMGRGNGYVMVWGSAFETLGIYFDGDETVSSKTAVRRRSTRETLEYFWKKLRLR